MAFWATLGQRRWLEPAAPPPPPALSAAVEPEGHLKTQTPTSRLWWGEACSQHRWKPQGHVWLLWFSPDTVEPRLEGRISNPRPRAPAQSPPRRSPLEGAPPFPWPPAQPLAFSSAYLALLPHHLLPSQVSSPSGFGQGLGVLWIGVPVAPRWCAGCPSPSGPWNRLQNLETR